MQKLNKRVKMNDSVLSKVLHDFEVPAQTIVYYCLQCLGAYLRGVGDEQDQTPSEGRNIDELC